MDGSRFVFTARTFASCLLSITRSHPSQCSLWKRDLACTDGMPEHGQTWQILITRRRLLFSSQRKTQKEEISLWILGLRRFLYRANKVVIFSYLSPLNIQGVENNKGACVYLIWTAREGRRPASRFLCLTPSRMTSFVDFKWLIVVCAWEETRKLSCSGCNKTESLDVSSPSCFIMLTTTCFGHCGPSSGHKNVQWGKTIQCKIISCGTYSEFSARFR